MSYGYLWLVALVLVYPWFVTALGCALVMVAIKRGVLDVN